MRTIASIVAIVAVGMMMSSCSSEGGSSAQIASASLPTERYDYTSTTPIAHTEDAPECKMTMSIIYAVGNDEVAQRVNSAITKLLFAEDSTVIVPAAAEAFARQYTTDYTRTYGRYFRADANRPERWAQYEFRYEIETEMGDGRNGITTYKATTYFYEGGAHGIEQVRTLNIDKDGNMVTIGDILVPGYERHLENALFTALEEHAGVKGLPALQEVGYLNTTDIYIPQNYIIGKDCITFIYNVYEIAPYALGRTTLTLTYTTLEEIMAQYRIV